MWPLFESRVAVFRSTAFRCFCLLLIILSVFPAKSAQPALRDTFNPAYVDSLLSNVNDSVASVRLETLRQLPYRPVQQKLIQPVKAEGKSVWAIVILVVVVLLFVLIRLIFQDFTQSMIQGMGSFKKFFLYYQSNKFDSPLAVLLLFILRLPLSALAVYLAYVYVSGQSFIQFDLWLFTRILLLLAVFWSFKAMLEYSFTGIVRAADIYRASFLIRLFADLVFSSLFILMLMIMLYNDFGLSYSTCLVLLALVLLYLLFNMIRSYQLLTMVRVKYQLHFFWYICAFKVMPLCILLKYLTSQVLH